MKIAYEPHPISPERKAELRKQGFKIIDALFAPQEAEKPVELPSREDITSMKREAVIEWLEAHGVESPKGKLEDLKAKLIAVMFVEA